MSHTPYFKFNNQIFHCIIVLDYERKQTAIKQLLLRLVAVLLCRKHLFRGDNRKQHRYLVVLSCDFERSVLFGNHISK